MRDADGIVSPSRCAAPGRWIVACLAAVLVAGCGAPPARDRVIVLGLDGMDPDVVDQLVAEGALPSFRRLREQGASGRLVSQEPILSPIIWTTIATGLPPDRHGIGHFTAVNPQTGKELPVTSRQRKTKALWNVLSEAGRSVAVVGWWATWPAETVRGSIVSDHTCYHFLFPEGQTGATDTSGVTHPPELLDRLTPLIRRPGDVTAADVAPYVAVTAEELARPFAFTDDLGHFKWALATADTYRTVGLELWKTEQPDVLLVYIEAPDSTSHLFGHLFRARGLVGELAEQQRKFGHAVEAMYRHADEIVGEYLAAMDDDTTLVVLSDHGFQLGALQDDPSKTRDMRRVSERFHEIEGILYLYGNRVRPGVRIEQPVLVDVAPTVLALEGIAPAKDMPGRVLTAALDLPEPERTVASFETGTTVADAAGEAPKIDGAIVEHLKSLGYLDTSSPKSTRTMANLAFEQGRYQEAVDAFTALVQEHPDDGSLRASLGGALGALERYDEALLALDEAVALEPLNPEARHNRGVVLEKQGKADAAIAEYRTALRYSPRYEASRRALERLTGSADPSAPRNAAQQLARQKAERAADAARRGDYAGARAELDAAEQIAPRYALLFQYRANVAYLEGDRAAAIAALRRGLEIEPDNELFQANLRRLEQGGAAAPQPPLAPPPE